MNSDEQFNKALKIGHILGLQNELFYGGIKLFKVRPPKCIKARYKQTEETLKAVEAMLLDPELIPETIGQSLSDGIDEKGLIYTLNHIAGETLVAAVAGKVSIKRINGIKGAKSKSIKIKKAKVNENTIILKKGIKNKKIEVSEKGKTTGEVGAKDGLETKYSPINPCDKINQEVAESFNGATFTEKVLTEDTVMYRVSDGKAGEVGSYLSKTLQGGGLQSQLDLALNPDWGNTAESVGQVIVPKGTVIYEGTAAPQNILDSVGNIIGTLPGGGNQVFIPKVEEGWFK